MLLKHSNTMKTVLAIGDMCDWDSFKKFYRQRRLFSKHGFKFKNVEYKSILRDEFPSIKTEKIIIFFFFPFNYWNKKIETKHYKGVYGNRYFYIKFRKFWNEITKKLNDHYHDKQIFYVNHPQQITLDRDKYVTSKILEKNNILVPKYYRTRDLKKILRFLDEGRKLFIKVRYGSMGKGITYLEKKYWFTNFRFKNNKIISKKSDYGWKFRNKTGNKKFLKALLKEDIIIEEAINPLLLKGRKFDLRMYVCFGKVVYIYPRSNDPIQPTTNISQGAIGEGKEFLESIPPKVLRDSIKYAIRSTKAMKLNFAGVDIMPNGKGVTVIEVNTFPGFPKTRKFNLSKYIIKEITQEKWI